MSEIDTRLRRCAADVALRAPRHGDGASAGVDLLWPGDPAIWADVSPILFPVVGWTRDGEERVDGVAIRSACTASRVSRPSRSRHPGLMRAADPQ